MTIWMYKSGEILLRSQECDGGLFLYSNGNGQLLMNIGQFFTEHCVYIGEFE